jgi:hypothetical protein
VVRQLCWLAGKLTYPSIARAISAHANTEYAVATLRPARPTCGAWKLSAANRNASIGARYLGRWADLSGGRRDYWCRMTTGTVIPALSVEALSGSSITTCIAGLHRQHLMPRS